MRLKVFHFTKMKGLSVESSCISFHIAEHIQAKKSYDKTIRTFKQKRFGAKAKRRAWASFLLRLCVCMRISRTVPQASHLHFSALFCLMEDLMDSTTDVHHVFKSKENMKRLHNGKVFPNVSAQTTPRKPAKRKHAHGSHGVKQKSIKREEHSTSDVKSQTCAFDEFKQMPRWSLPSALAVSLIWPGKATHVSC